MKIKINNHDNADETYSAARIAVTEVSLILGNFHCEGFQERIASTVGALRNQVIGVFTALDERIGVDVLNAVLF